MREGSDPSKPRVMIVEDDPIIAIDLEETLTEWDYLVCGIAHCAASALDIAAHHRPRLALVDVGLRGPMDGVDLAIRLRRDFALPSIIVTGGLGDDLVERVSPATPAGFLSKPYTPFELKQLLSDAFARLSAVT